MANLNNPRRAGCALHSIAEPAGICVDCQSNFCHECVVEIKRHGTVCLDCGAGFARKKLMQACIALGLGLAAGVLIAFQEASRHNWGFAIAAPFIYAYLFAATFFGWHYGGKIWAGLSSIIDHFTGIAGGVATCFLLSFRLVLAMFLGGLGGGILQYLRYREIVIRHRRFSIPGYAQSTST